MSTRSWLNLVLFVVVAALAAVAVFQPGLESPPPVPPLTERTADSVSRVRVERPDQPVVVLERRDGQWLQTEPLALAANGFRVQALLEVLGVKSEGRLDPAGLELHRFGLDLPRAALVLDDLRIEFGDTESLSGRRYVRVGDAVHLIADRFYHQLVGGAPSFVDLSPLGPAPQPVAIELPGLRLRQEGGRWLVEPDQPDQGADAAARLVDAWRYAQAITVRPYEPAPSLSPSLAVWLKGREEPLRFQVVETPQALVLARPDAGVQYQFTTEAAERLLRLPPPPAAVGTPGTETEEGDGGAEPVPGEADEPDADVLLPAGDVGGGQEDGATPGDSRAGVPPPE